MQEKQNLQKEKRKSREATSYKSNRTTTTIKLCRNAKQIPRGTVFRDEPIF
jgi:hypothetical protein